MILISGQNLQRRYSNGTSSDILTNAKRTEQKSDFDALKLASIAKRASREASQEARMQNDPRVAIKTLEENPLKDINVQEIVKVANEVTNVLARQYGLAEPNNPEALAHDRTHCITCDRLLHNPNAHKEDNNSIFDETEVRLMCCWCFGRFGDEQIKNTMYTGRQADAKIRLAVYNPVESTKAEIDSLVETKMIQMRVKLRRWEQDTKLIGNVKHDYLQEGDYMENQVLYNSKGIYACTL